MAEHDEPRGITFQPDIYPKVLERVPEDRSIRILDLGAGEGYVCKLLKDRGYTGVEACDYLEDNFKVEGVPFHKADLNERIPLPDACFDCLISIEVLEHMENHIRFMREAMRVLKPGGIAIFTTPNILSIPSRWHFFLYGYTDCAPRPLDPAREDYYMQHINPISVPEILFLTERFGGEMIDLTTNRVRRSARLPALLLRPFLSMALRAKLLRAKYADEHDVNRRHIRWVLHPANLAGRITIAVCRRKA